MDIATHMFLFKGRNLLVVSACRKADKFSDAIQEVHSETLSEKKRKSYQEQLRQKGGNLQNEAMCTFSSITLLSMGTNDLK